MAVGVVHSHMISKSGTLFFESSESSETVTGGFDAVKIIYGAGDMFDSNKAKTTTIIQC